MMRINTRFPVAIHILALIALNQGGKWGENTSELIAKSVNTNPVVIRRINAMLKRANLITVKPGVGGTTLNFEPKDISLLDVYNAVKISTDAVLFNLHDKPNQKCPIGANIHEALAEPLVAAQKKLENSLGNYTLLDVIKKISDKTGVSGEYFLS